MDESAVDALLRDLKACNLTSQQAVALRILLHTLDAVAFAAPQADAEYRSNALGKILSRYSRLAAAGGGSQ